MYVASYKKCVKTSKHRKSLKECTRVYLQTIDVDLQLSNVPTMTRHYEEQITITPTRDITSTAQHASMFNVRLVRDSETNRI